MAASHDSPPRASVLEPSGFDPRCGCWKAGVGPQKAPAGMLTFVTYNIWFDEYRAQDRIAAVLELIERCHPDVVGLQEVTPVHLERILAADGVRRRYWISDACGKTLQPHGVVLLSRFPFAGMALCHLPSDKHRKLLVGEIRTARGPLHVGTVHLESSPESTPVRLEQLDRMLSGLHAPSDVLLMGDFNFDPGQRAEQSSIEQSYTDLWRASHGDEPGYTVDSIRNAMRFAHKQVHKRARFDRILLRSEGQAWMPVSGDLIGTEPISPEHPEVFPSDHFGVVGVIAGCCSSP